MFAALWSSFNASDFDFEILSLDEAFKASSDLDVESKELTDSMIGIQDLLENEVCILSDIMNYAHVKTALTACFHFSLI